MPGGGPQGAGRLLAGSRDGSLPVASAHRQRLTRRPGYMRSTARTGIRFLSPAVDTSCRAPRGLIGGELYNSECKAGQCSLDPSSHCQGSLVGSRHLKSSPTPDVASGGHLHSAQGSVRETLAHSRAPLRTGNRLPGTLTGSCNPWDPACQQEFLSMDSSESPGSSLDAAWSEGARSARAVGSPASLESSTTPGSQDAFSSSFSFIQLSLGIAGERGEAEGCLPSREAESPHQSAQEMGAQVSSSDGQHEDPRQLRAFGLLAESGSVDLARVAGSSSRPECSMSSLNTDTGSSSQDPSLPGGQADEGSSWGGAQRWGGLLKEWELVLQDCLRSHHRQLEVTSLSLKLQKLQEKAIEDGDYDKAESLRQRLEDLEQEKARLPWTLPSQQPALGSFLSYLAAQTWVALHGSPQRAGSDDLRSPTGGEPRPLETTTQASLCASITRRDWLMQEKQQVQKAIEALQARLSALEAKEQQLGREMEEQETQGQWSGRDLMPLLAQLSPGQLQELRRALGETLASASQVPFCMELPGALRSLQERTRSLNLAIREVTAQLCSSERLCSSLRKRLGDLDTRLPALLETKMLAVSEARVKDSTVKYMEMLEGQLCSCRCPLLGRVWEADLEACRLLMQSLELQEEEGIPCAEDERRTDSTKEAMWMPALADQPGSHAEEEEKAPLPAVHEWGAHLGPPPHRAGGEQKQESSIVSAELEEKCEAISTKLLHLEDQLHVAVHSHDEALFQSLWGELQMVKETLQAMILQLQPAKEGEEERPGLSTPQLAPGKPKPELRSFLIPEPLKESEHEPASTLAASSCRNVIRQSL